VKKVTDLEFFRTQALADGLAPGESLQVTKDGKPWFVVTKAGRRRITREEIEACAVPSKPLNVVKFLDTIR
jgi:hypothetical protein